MALKTAYRSRTDRLAFRVSAPPPQQEADWEKIEVEKLSGDERANLGIERISEAFLAKMRGLEQEIDGLKARLLAMGGTDGGAARKVEPVNLLRLVRAIREKDWSKAEYERSVVDSPEARQLAATTDADGGYMVPSQYLGSEFIALLRANTVIDKLGVRRLDDLMGSPVNIPKQTGGATAYWVGENAEITASKQATGQIALRPRKLAALTKVSNELIRLANPSAEAFVQEDLARVIGLALDNAALSGTGASGEPIGVKATASINTTSVTASATPDHVFDMLYELELDNVDVSTGVALVSHPNVWNMLRKAADAAGTPKIYAGVGYKILDEVLGFPAHRTTQLGTGEAILGKWSDLIVGSWAGISFRASQDAGDAFAYDQTWIRATMLVDVGVRHPQSFCYNAAFGT